MSVSGSDWGTISSYKWANVSWPEGAGHSGTGPNARYVKMSSSSTTNSITLARLFLGSSSGNETALAAGDYTFACTVYDAMGHSKTTDIITVTVSRPAQAIEIWHDYGEADDGTMDVTGTNQYNNFVVMDGAGDTGQLRAVFAPRNSVGDGVTFSSSDSSVTVASGGLLTAETAGSARITASGTAGGNTLTANTMVYVPRTRYAVTIPEEWLTPVAGEKVHRGTIGDFPGSSCKAELVWNYIGQFGRYEYTADTFEGDLVYYPTVRIRPYSNVCYPVKIDYGYSRTDYNVDPDAFELTVNGVSYLGAAYCGQDCFYDTAPLSSEGSDDFIDFDLDPTEKLIDWRDDYVSKVRFSLSVPGAGDPKDVTGGDDITNLNYTLDTEGLQISDSVMRVTDMDSIEDDDPSNDALEAFETYEADETYRSSVTLVINSFYRNEDGGRARFADKVTVIEPELGALTDDSHLPNLLYGYVYFTVSEPESDALADGIQVLMNVATGDSAKWPVSPATHDADADGAVTGKDAVKLLMQGAKALDTDCKVLVSSYDKNGRSLKTLVLFEGGNVQKSDFTGAARIKVFFVDGQFRPMRNAIERML